MWLLGNGLTARRTLRPEAAHCRVGEKSKQNQSTERAAMCGLYLALISDLPPDGPVPDF